MTVETNASSQCPPEADDDRRRKPIVVSTPAGGMLWFGGWLFTIAFAQLGFWKAVLAILIWPYFLGVIAR